MLNDRGWTWIVHSTVTGNHAASGGGVWISRSQNATYLQGSLIWGNTADGVTADDVAAEYHPSSPPRYTSLGHNLIGAAGENVDLGMDFRAIGDRTGVKDAGLAAELRDNSGPTLTHALLPDSPAIDAGTCQDHAGSEVETDQRGVGRPQGSACDLGAFEYVPTTLPGYVFVSFTAPVSDPGKLNLAKAGETIPLQWRLLDGSGQPVTTLSSVAVTVSSLDCGANNGSDVVEEYAAGKSGLQNLGDGYYQYNWQTPKSYANSCKTLTLTRGETGPTAQALFEFTK